MNCASVVAALVKANISLPLKPYGAAPPRVKHSALGTQMLLLSTSAELNGLLLQVVHETVSNSDVNLPNPKLLHSLRWPSEILLCLQNHYV